MRRRRLPTSSTDLGALRETSGPRIDRFPSTRPPWCRRQCRERERRHQDVGRSAHLPADAGPLGSGRRRAHQLNPYSTPGAHTPPDRRHSISHYPCRALLRQRTRRRRPTPYITLKLHIDTLLLLDAPVVLFLLEPARRALAVVINSRRGHGLGLLAELHAAVDQIVELAALPPRDVD